MDLDGFHSSHFDCQGPLDPRSSPAADIVCNDAAGNTSDLALQCFLPLILGLGFDSIDLIVNIVVVKVDAG